MNKDEMKGKVENLKGRAKEAAGALSGNKEREIGGVAERVKGAVREKLGEGRRHAAHEIEGSESDDE